MLQKCAFNHSEQFLKLGLMFSKFYSISSVNPDGELETKKKLSSSFQANTIDFNFGKHVAENGKSSQEKNLRTKN